VLDESGREVVAAQEGAVGDEEGDAAFGWVDSVDAGAAGGAHVGLGEFVVGGGEADFESFGFAGPAFALGLGDARQEVVADLFQAAPLIGGNPQEWASDA